MCHHQEKDQHNPNSQPASKKAGVRSGSDSRISAILKTAAK